MLLGVISDTHSLLRPQVLPELAGCDLIVHAGDVGNTTVLSKLAELAPVHAVRGNTDHDKPLASLPLSCWVSVGAVKILVLHDLGMLNVAALPAATAAVIYGHSHVSSIQRRRDILYFNPGSAGPRRFNLPVTVGRLRVDAAGLHPEIVQLNLATP